MKTTKAGAGLAVGKVDPKLVGKGIEAGAKIAVAAISPGGAAKPAAADKDEEAPTEALPEVAPTSSFPSWAPYAAGAGVLLLIAGVMFTSGGKALAPSAAPRRTAESAPATAKANPRRRHRRARRQRRRSA